MAFLLPLLWLAACRDSSVAVYRIAKENDAPAVAARDLPPGGASPAGPVFANAGGAGLEWTAPAHWKSKPASAMRKGTYVMGEEGPAGAELGITAFPGDVGGDLANVNRWRGQLGLPPIVEADLAGALTQVETNGLKILVVELTGGTPGSPLRMLGAIVPYDGSTWFFKLTGNDSVVAREKSAYLEFLRTVKARAAEAVVAPASVASPPADLAGTAVPKADGPGLKWTAPAHWQAKPATAMRKATYVVAGADGATAEIAVTAFPGDVGGELANVNRWRGQLQLPPIAESEFAGAVTRSTTPYGLPVTLVDLTGGPADKPVRLLGAIVPSNGANWFFKFTGPPALVAQEKPAFLALVQSLRAP